MSPTNSRLIIENKSETDDKPIKTNDLSVTLKTKKIYTAGKIKGRDRDNRKYNRVQNNNNNHKNKNKPKNICKSRSLGGKLPEQQYEEEIMGLLEAQDIEASKSDHEIRKMDTTDGLNFVETLYYDYRGKLEHISLKSSKGAPSRVNTKSPMTTSGNVSGYNNDIYRGDTSPHPISEFGNSAVKTPESFHLQSFSPYIQENYLQEEMIHIYDTNKPDPTGSGSNKYPAYTITCTKSRNAISCRPIKIIDAITPSFQSTATDISKTLSKHLKNVNSQINGVIPINREIRACSKEYQPLHLGGCRSKNSYDDKFEQYLEKLKLEKEQREYETAYYLKQIEIANKMAEENPMIRHNVYYQHSMAQNLDKLDKLKYEELNGSRMTPPDLPPYLMEREPYVRPKGRMMSPNLTNNNKNGSRTTSPIYTNDLPYGIPNSNPVSPIMQVQSTKAPRIGRSNKPFYAYDAGNNNGRDSPEYMNVADLKKQPSHNLDQIMIHEEQQQQQQQSAAPQISTHHLPLNVQQSYATTYFQPSIDGVMDQNQPSNKITNSEKQYNQALQTINNLPQREPSFIRHAKNLNNLNSLNLTTHPNLQPISNLSPNKNHLPKALVEFAESVNCNKIYEPSLSTNDPENSNQNKNRQLCNFTDPKMKRSKSRKDIKSGSQSTKLRRRNTVNNASQNQNNRLESIDEIAPDPNSKNNKSHLNKNNLLQKLRPRSKSQKIEGHGERNANKMGRRASFRAKCFKECNKSTDS